MRNRCLSVILLSLLLTLGAAAQVTPRPIGQVPKKVAVQTPRLNVIQLVSPELVVVDLGRDGLDLSGEVRTSLVTGSAAVMRWVKPQGDDAIVVVNATTLRAGGWSLTTAAGEQLDGFVFPRGGLRATDPSGASFAASDARDLLARLDGNRDGRINKSDAAWSAIALFRDDNADGTIGAGELTAAEELLRAIAVAASGSESSDAFGTSLVPGTARLRNGTTIAIAYVRPAAIK
ncbi:MAG TPA: hypothetical protein VGF28_12415 [Thermoanaerobaculia bacterium]|jgi:hypothetical protein